MTDTERTIFQRRIKNQRRALRLLNRHIAMQNALLARYRAESLCSRVMFKEYAAKIAERHWFGYSIAEAIRRSGL